MDSSTIKPRLHFAAPPTPQDVQHVASIVAMRVNHMLGPKGLLREPWHESSHAIDVTGEPLADWVIGVDPEPPDPVERAPPRDWDCVDPPPPDG